MSASSSPFVTVRDLRAVFPQLGRWALYALARRLDAKVIAGRLFIPRAAFEKLLAEGEVRLDVPSSVVVPGSAEGDR